MGSSLHIPLLADTGCHAQGPGWAQLLAEQRPAWLVAELGAAGRAHTQDYLLLTKHQDPSDALQCCFCCHSHLVHLEGLIVLLHGNRSLDCSCQAMEAAWAPAQPLEPARPGCHPHTAPETHRCCCLSNCQAHRHSKSLHQNNGATTKSLLMVPIAPSKPHG